MGRVIRIESKKQSILMNYSNYQDEKSDNEIDSEYHNIGRFRKGYKHIVLSIVLELGVIFVSSCLKETAIPVSAAFSIEVTKDKTSPVVVQLKNESYGADEYV